MRSSCSLFVVVVVLTLRYLVDEPLAESRRDPLPGVDATIHEDGRFGAAALLTELRDQKVTFIGYSFPFFQHLPQQRSVSDLEDGHGASLVRLSDHLLADQISIGGGDGGDPGLDLWGFF